MAEKTERESQQTEGMVSGNTEVGSKKTEAFGTGGKFTVTLHDGKVVADRYKVICQLGHRSGEAFIYLCADLQEKEKQIVLKLYHSDFLPEEGVLEKLLATDHPDIIKVYSLGNFEGQLYEVMEYAAGGSLADRARNRRYTEDELTSSVIPEVLNAFEYLHEKYIIHGDIKPENMFYKDKDQSDLVVGDFGLSSILSEGISVIQIEGGLTPDFAAPEIFGYKGERLVSIQSDYYALGMSLLWLHLGKSPFKGLNDVQIMAKHTSDDLQLLFPNTLSPRFRNMLSGLLVKLRKKRWGASEIKKWLKGEDVPVYKDDLSQSSRPVHSPYKLRKISADTTEQLAVLLQTYADDDELAKHLGAKLISKWLGSFEQVLSLDVEKVEEKEKNAKVALLTISCILDPNVPYFLAPDAKAETPKQLARLLDKNRATGMAHFQTGKLAVWLKHKPSGANILNRWNSYISGKESGSVDESDFESFLHYLDPEMPEANVSIAPTTANLGTVESISNKKIRVVKITNTGSRGLFSCGVRLKNEMEGVLLRMKTGSQINLLPNQSDVVVIEADATVMVPQKKYVNSIILTKNIETFRKDMSRTIEIPLTFFVDIPEYSKKIAKRPLKVD